MRRQSHDHKKFYNINGPNEPEMIKNESTVKITSKEI